MLYSAKWNILSTILEIIITEEEAFAQFNLEENISEPFIETPLEKPLLQLLIKRPLEKD